MTESEKDMVRINIYIREDQREKIEKILLGKYGYKAGRMMSYYIREALDEKLNKEKE